MKGDWIGRAIMTRRVVVNNNRGKRRVSDQSDLRCVEWVGCVCAGR